MLDCDKILGMTDYGKLSNNKDRKFNHSILNFICDRLFYQPLKVEVSKPELEELHNNYCFMAHMSYTVKNSLHLLINPKLPLFSV